MTELHTMMLRDAYVGYANEALDKFNINRKDFNAMVKAELANNSIAPGPEDYVKTAEYIFATIEDSYWDSIQTQDDTTDFI